MFFTAIPFHTIFSGSVQKRRSMNFFVADVSRILTEVEVV